jgi:hypothetical protein
MVKMRKKLLSLSILALLVIGLATTLNLGPVGISAVDYPSVYVDPESYVNPSHTSGPYEVAIKTDYTGLDITAYQFTLSYNPTVLNGVSLANGDIIDTGLYFFQPGTFDNTAGKLSLTGAFLFGAGVVVPGPGTLATVTFEVVGIGDSDITLGKETQLKGWNGVGVYDIVNGITMPFHLGHGYFANEEATVHDVAVNSVTPVPTEVIRGDSVTITVDVENKGTATETFDVTVYTGALSLETKTVTGLAAGATETLAYIWDTTDYAAITYTIVAEASTVDGEENTEDNTLTDGNVKVSPAIAASFDAPDTGLWNVFYEFDASDSYTSGGASIVKYTWNFKDEVNETIDPPGEFNNWILVETADPIIEHKFSRIGVYGVEMWVTDDLGRVSTHAYHGISIEYPTVIGAALVNYMARPDTHNWDESTDDDGYVNITALASNTGSGGEAGPIDVTVTFGLLDADGSEAGPAVLVDLTLDLGETVPVTVSIDPYDYGYVGEKKYLYGQVTLEYDSDGDGIPDALASTKTFRFAVKP